MKKKYIFITYLFFVSSLCFSQVSSYIFLQSNSTFSPISGGSLLGTVTNDEQFFTDSGNLVGGNTANTGPGLPIGFNFTYNGSAFDRIGINTNGWISLGQSSLSPAVNMGGTTASNIYTPISSNNVITPAQLRNRISGMGGDLQGQTGSSLRVQTIGTAPYRILVVQWINYRHFNTNGDNLNFQIQLHETYNKVSIVYGANSYTSSNSNSYEVGIGGQSNADFNNRGTAPTNGDWNQSFPGGGSATGCFINMGAVMPVSGLTFNWGMATPCSGTPVAGSISPTSLNLCTGAAVGNLTVSGFSEFVTGYVYQWEQSNDNFATTPINAVGGTGANTTSYSPPAFSGTNIYYRLKITCVNSGQIGYSAVIPVTIKSAPSIVTSNVTVSIPFTTATVTWTNGNGARRVVLLSKSPIVVPTNNTGPAITANSVYSGSGQQIVYDGTGTSVILTGFALSEVYYLAVIEYNLCSNGSQFDYYYNNTIGAGNSKVFATQVQNDFCFGPTILTPSGSFNTGAIVGTMFNANSTSGNPVPNFPSCQTLAVNDVWYSVVVPASGRLTIETQVNTVDSITDSILGVYSGADCFGLTQVACDDDSGPVGVNDYMAITTVTGRTPGETLFIGVWNYSTTPTINNRFFRIAAYDATLETEDFEEASFSAYPNPVKDILHLSYKNQINEISIFNMLGQEVVQKQIKSNEGNIDMSGLPKGNYFVKIISDGQAKMMKIIKSE